VDESAVSSTGLTKRFRRQVAVDGVDLAVPRGAVYGFLGPNGSGKTTTIRMLLGLIGPTAGSHALLGRDMPQHSGDVLPRVGALVEGPAFHPYLSGRANLLRLHFPVGDPHAMTEQRRVGRNPLVEVEVAEAGLERRHPLRLLGASSRSCGRCTSA